MVTASSSRRDDQNDTEDGLNLDLPADYKPYVPVAKRRAQLRSTLTGKQQQAKKAKEKQRRERTLMQAAQEVKEQKALAGES